MHTSPWGTETFLISCQAVYRWRFWITGEQLYKCLVTPTYLIYFSFVCNRQRLTIPDTLYTLKHRYTYPSVVQKPHRYTTLLIKQKYVVNRWNVWVVKKKTRVKFISSVVDIHLLIFLNFNLDSFAHWMAMVFVRVPWFSVYRILSCWCYFCVLGVCLFLPCMFCHNRNNAADRVVCLLIFVC